MYGLVGGREGSLEAENTILGAFEKCAKEETQIVTQIAQGSTHPEVCLSLVRLVESTEVEAVCLVSHKTHLNPTCINALSGAIDAPIISFADDRIDYHLIDWLEGKKPANIFIIDAEHGEASQEYKKHKFSWNPKISELEVTSTDHFEITLELYDQFCSQTKSSTEAVIANYGAYRETSILLAGLMNCNEIPYFCIDLENEGSDLELNELRKRGLKRLLLVGKTTQERRATNAGFDVVNLTAETFEQSQQNVHEYLNHEHHQDNSQEAVIVPDLDTMHIKGSACGYYSKQKNSAMLIVDDTDLDSIAYAVKFIQDNKIKKLTFLGGAGALSQSVFDLLSKVAASNQSK